MSYITRQMLWHSGTCTCSSSKTFSDGLVLNSYSSKFGFNLLAVIKDYQRQGKINTCLKERSYYTQFFWYQESYIEDLTEYALAIHKRGHING